MQARTYVEIEEGQHAVSGRIVAYSVTVSTRTSMIVDSAEEAAKLFVQWQDRKVELVPDE